MEENKELRLKMLIEVHKQNEDFDKSVLTVLTTIAGGFITLVTATVLASSTLSLSSGELGQEGRSLPTSAYLVNLPYPIFALLLFQAFILWISQWRSGYQKFVEEQINCILEQELLVWQTRNSKPMKGLWTPSIAFMSSMFVFLVFSFWAALPQLFKLEGVSFNMHSFAYTLFLLFLLLSYVAIFRAQDKGYNYSKHGVRHGEETLRRRARYLYEKDGGKDGNDADYWEKAKRPMALCDWIWISLRKRP